MGEKIRQLWTHVKQYFNLLNDKEDEQQVVEQVSAGVVFRGTNLWILIFAILIASLGLNVNSTAVIIGAMLVSPLMGPIIGMGLSVGIGDYDLLRQALKNYLVATLISIVTATVFFLISPLGEAQSELLARTSPTLYDVLIAFCGGAAGVLALTTKSKGQVIPGVAIATALMPPLCTAGYGLATAQWNYFLGAFYLFFINTVFIALSTFLGVKLLRFHTKSSPVPERRRYGRRLMVAIVVITMVPAAYMTWNIVKKNIFDRNVRSFVAHELQQSGTQILSATVEHDTLRVVSVGRPISDSEVADARSRMGYYSMKGMELSVIQGTAGDGNSAFVAAMADEVNHMRDRVAELQSKMESTQSDEALSEQLLAEAKTMFPKVKSLSIGHLTGGNSEGHWVVLVEASMAEKHSTAEEEKMATWLKTRLQDDGAKIATVTN